MKHERTQLELHALGGFPGPGQGCRRKPLPAPELPWRDGFPDHQARRPVPQPEELESLRTLGEQIRQYNLGKLPDLLLQLEANLTRNGIQVHWAETPDEANAIILGICQRHRPS
jgi:hypothetical protein